MGYRRRYKYCVVNIGVKIFTKNRDLKGAAKYRLVQDGITLLLPFLNNNRKIFISKEQFLEFLST
jgi:hypothetical protein